MVDERELEAIVEAFPVAASTEYPLRYNVPPFFIQNSSTNISMTANYDDYSGAV